MRKIFLLTIALTTFGLQAQKTIKSGPTVALAANNTESSVKVKNLGTSTTYDAQNYWYTTTYFSRLNENVGEQSLTIEVVKPDLSIGKSLNLSISEGGPTNALFHEDVFFNGKKFSVICFRWQKKSKTEKFLAFEIVDFDANGTRLTTEAKLLTKHAAASRFKEPKYAWCVSPNKKYLALIASPFFNKKEKQKIEVKVFETSTWTEVSSGTKEFTFLDSKNKRQEVVVDNFGTAIVTKSNPVSKKEASTLVFKLPKGGALQELKWGNNSFAQDVRVDSTEENTSIITGLLSKSVDRKIKGFFQIKLDAAGKETVVIKEWSDDEVKAMGSTGELSYDGFTKTFNSMYLADVYVKENGNTQLLFQNITSEMESTVGSDGTTVNAFYNIDQEKMYVLELDKQGNKAWDLILKTDHKYKTKNPNAIEVTMPKIVSGSKANSTKIMYVRIGLRKWISAKTGDSMMLDSKESFVFELPITEAGSISVPKLQFAHQEYGANVSKIVDYNAGGKKRDFAVFYLNTFKMDGFFTGYINHIDQNKKNYYYFRY